MFFLFIMSTVLKFYPIGLFRSAFIAFLSVGSERFILIFKPRISGPQTEETKSYNAISYSRIPKVKAYPKSPQSCPPVRYYRWALHHECPSVRAELSPRFDFSLSCKIMYFFYSPWNVWSGNREKTKSRVQGIVLFTSILCYKLLLRPPPHLLHTVFFSIFTVKLRVKGMAVFCSLKDSSQRIDTMMILTSEKDT